jgi:hypothetical protein
MIVRRGGQVISYDEILREQEEKRTQELEEAKASYAALPMPTLPFPVKSVVSITDS